MTARSRAARLHLRARLFSRQRRQSAAIQELTACQVALMGAAGAIAAGIHTGMLDSDGAYELLRSVHDRLHRAIGQTTKAVNANGGAA